MAILWILIAAAPVFAADVANVIGSAGDYGREAGQAAETNRRLADQLYQQSLASEKAGWASTIPNVGLLMKALQQSKDAKSADDQSKEFARAALKASETGARSGEFISSRYGMVPESKLKELSTTSSKYMPQVEKNLGRYGMKLSADKMTLQTLFGNFATNAEDGVLLNAATSIMKKMGFSTAGIEKGVKEAISERDELAKKLMEEAEQKATKTAEDGSNAGRQIASVEPPKAVEEGNKVIGAAAGASAVKDFDAPDWNATEKAVLESRKAMGKELGLESSAEPLGRRTQDIFRMINLRYQSLYSEGAFFSK
jgi:hypothetical protein